jgi:hypothetical protein
MLEARNGLAGNRAAGKQYSSKVRIKIYVIFAHII